jgi:hypothetical protein
MSIKNQELGEKKIFSFIVGQQNMQQINHIHCNGLYNRYNSCISVTRSYNRYNSYEKLKNLNYQLQQNYNSYNGKLSVTTVVITVTMDID